MVAQVGDLDWFCNYLHVEPHFNSKTPCWLCDCNDSTIPWNDFGERAAWQQHRHDPAVPRVVSQVAFFRLPGVTGENICIDVLHTLCLGVAAHATGSVLADLIDQRSLGRNVPQRLQRVWGRIRELYVEFGATNRLNNLRHSMFVKTGKFSELSARAAEIRSLVPILGQICQEELEERPTVDKAHRFLVMRSLTSVYAILDRNGFQLTEQDKEGLKKNAWRVARHFRVLAKAAMGRGLLRWQLTIKMHFFLHLLDQAKSLNPRYGWTYQYENFVQKILRVSRACAKGTPPHKTGPSIMSKYRSVMSVRFRKKDCDGGSMHYSAAWQERSQLGNGQT